MTLLLITLPIFSTIISGLLGRYLGINYTKYLCIISLFITSLIVYYIFIDILFNDSQYYLYIYNWLYIDYLDMSYSINIDLLSITMLLPIVTISLLVNIYAYNYMSHDPHQQRFYTYLSLFTSFMIILVISDSYIMAFIGWEYIGVASFLLIGYWYTSISVIKASLSAFLINKIGDWLFIIALIIMINNYGSFNYSIIFSLVPYINTDINNIIMITLLIAASAKSAQFGLHGWLIWAMAGPTPVSVLLHAATLVIAGVYILIRSSFILEFTPTILLLIIWLGAITTIIAGLISIYSNDLKRIIALSTMSQLGMMFIAIGSSLYNIALFHLLCHSVYKALLFMAAGSIIHNILSESQDIRIMGINIKYLPITYISMLSASLSLMALPFMTGYYSKDIIIESMMGNYYISGYTIYWLSLLSAIFTTIYSTKLIYYAFINTPALPKYYYNYIHESDLYFLLPMCLLSIGAIIMGYIFKDIYIGLGSYISGIFIHPNNIYILDTEFSINHIYKLLPLYGIIIGTISVLYIYELQYYKVYIYNNEYMYKIYTLFNSRFLYDQLLNNKILRPLLSLSSNINNNIEKGLIYNIGPYGIWKLLNNLSYKIGSLTTGILYHYALYLLYTLIFIILTILILLIYPYITISISNILIIILLIGLTILFI